MVEWRLIRSRAEARQRDAGAAVCLGQRGRFLSKLLQTPDWSHYHRLEIMDGAATATIAQIMRYGGCVDVR